MYIHITCHLLIGVSIILTQYDLELCALGFTELLFRTFQAELPDIPTWQGEWSKVQKFLHLQSSIFDNLCISLNHVESSQTVWGLALGLKRFKSSSSLGAGQESTRPCPACSWPTRVHGSCMVAWHWLALSGRRLVAPWRLSTCRSQ